MNMLMSIIDYLFPLTAFYCLIQGINKKAINYVISSLWLSLIALILHYQKSGGTILGSYYHYNNAFIDSFNLIIFTTSIIYIIEYLRAIYPRIKKEALLIQIVIALTSLLILFNLLTNAFFINNRLKGTPIIQVALMQKPSYCSYKYVFYKIKEDGSTDYLCPNYYGFIPKIGHLNVSPDFLVQQLSLPNKKQMLLLQQKNKLKN